MGFVIVGEYLNFTKSAKRSKRLGVKSMFFMRKEGSKLVGSFPFSDLFDFMRCTDNNTSV